MESRRGESNSDMNKYHPPIKRKPPGLERKPPGLERKPPGLERKSPGLKRQPLDLERKPLDLERKPPGTKEFGIKLKVPNESLEQLLKPVHSTFNYSSLSSSSDDSSDDEKSCSKQTISIAQASFFTEPEPHKDNSDEDEEEEEEDEEEDEDEDDETETHVSENGENEEMDKGDGAIDENYECKEDNCQGEIDESEEGNESVASELEVSDQNLPESSELSNTQKEQERFLKLCVSVRYEGQRSNAEALRLYKEGAHDRAIHEFKWAAKHCHCIPAYYNLGLCFMEKQDFMKAIRYYKVAADKDHAKACYNIAIIILKYRTKLETKYTEADGIMFLKRAAELGLKQAQVEYGVILMEKKENAEGAGMAARFLERAARQKYPRAMYLLGICYEKGLGVGVDHVKAADLYARASRGQHNLGVYFELGLGGLIENKEDAMNWYKEAVKNGHQKSMDDVERLERMDASKDEVTVVAEQPTIQDKPSMTKGDRVSTLIQMASHLNFIDDVPSSLEME